VSGQSARATQTLPEQTGVPVLAIWRRRAAAAIALVIVVSVPFRAHSAGDRIDLSEVRYGFAPGGVDPVSSDRFEWAGPHATIFASKQAQSLYLSVSPPANDSALELELRIDGRLADRLLLRDPSWMDMRLILPVTKSAHAFRRIDLNVRRTRDDIRPGSSQRDSNGPRVRVRTIHAQ
jgi:hypothetical protein